MRTVVTVAIGIIVAAVFFMPDSGIAQVDSSDSARFERWDEDLRAFSDFFHGRVSEFNREPMPGQKDLRRLYPNFDEELNLLRSALTGSSDQRIHLELARIVASAHVAHNNVFLSPGQRLPISLVWLAEGPVITGVSPEYGAIAGARLIAIGSLNSTELLESVGHYISYETHEWRRKSAERWAVNRGVLEAIGAVDSESAVVTIEANGEVKILTMEFLQPDVTQIPITEVLGLPPIMARSRLESRYYWSEYLSESQTMYIQYNICGDDPALPFWQFAARVLSDIDESSAKRVVIDLRYNGGGASWIIDPLIDGLRERRRELGRTVVLIGPATFSSAVMNARELDRRLDAVFLGESTGGLDGGYGESPSARLPHSGIRFQWTIKKFGSGKQIDPDIEVIVTRDDLLNARDPVLDAALDAKLQLR